MPKYIVLKRIGLVMLAMMMISVLYSAIWHKEGSNRPIWLQIIITISFLMISINNFRFKKYAQGWIFAGVTLACSISLYWDITAG